MRGGLRFRPGGQAQFTRTLLPPERGVSVRALSRRFHAETGFSPLQWLLHRRVERAKELLETTTLPMDVVARVCRLGAADSLRAHLLRRTGLTPSAGRPGARRSGTVPPVPAS